MSEQQEFNQIEQQLENNPSATVLVERSGGEITTGNVFGVGSEKTTVFLEGIHAESGNGRVPAKSVSSEKLSDGYQSGLAERLAGVALRGAVETSGIQTNEPTPERTGHFDAEKANLERAIRDAKEEKVRAQKEGRGEDSIYWTQRIGQLSRELDGRG